tara:strand:- start:31 stop:435 length:405 start_codon:yes stop_codon:yes gene_type:complete
MANGTIAFDTLQTSGQITGTAKSVDTDFVVNGSAKLFLEFDHTTNTLNNSLNVSSVTDSSTGKFIPVFTNSFSSATNYSCVGMCRSYNMIVDTDGNSKVAGSVKLRTWYASDTSGARTNIDVFHNSVICNGDLA